MKFYKNLRDSEKLRAEHCINSRKISGNIRKVCITLLGKSFKQIVKKILRKFLMNCSEIFQIQYQKCFTVFSVFFSYFEKL